MHKACAPTARLIGMQLHNLACSRALLAVWYLSARLSGAPDSDCAADWDTPVITASMSSRDLLANLLEELRSSVLYVWRYAAFALG